MSATPAQAPLEPPASALAPIAAERERARVRREKFRVTRPIEHAATQWGLALSGGGIRSATFCLGVLQGLVKAAPPPAQRGNTPPAPLSTRESLLPQFDYLSTVSGGGYIGSFFGSLFAVDRLNPGGRLDPSATAEQAYKVFEEEPPGRLRSSVVFDPATPGKAPLAWLRENGRYMAPTGTGDMVYATALAIRNWLAMQYVLGTVLLTAFAVIGLARTALVHGSLVHAAAPDYYVYEAALLEPVLADSMIWWSPIWWLMVPLVALWLLPCGLAFWLTHPGPGGRVSDPPVWPSKAAVWDLLVGALLLVLAFAGYRDLGPAWRAVFAALAVVGLMSVLGFVWHGSTTARAETISAQRVTLTRALARGLLWFAAIVLLAAVDTAAQSLYVNLGDIKAWLTPTAALSAIVWTVRRLAAAFAEKEREGWLQAIPFNAIVSLTGLVLLFLVALFWSMLVLWIQWQGAQPVIPLLSDTQAHWPVVLVLAVTTVLAVLLAFVSGRFPGFLNLSTLQGLYSARLTRAYLGASNGARFADQSPIKRSVAEPVEGDHVNPSRYYANPLMPIHIINVCVNQNSDPAEQLIQRDRKGKPLAILPSGFALDGDFAPFPPNTQQSELDAELTIGEWVGVSGAAFSTGLGRGTTLGYSLLLGLANIRLGRWWQSGLAGPAAGDVGTLVRRVFKTQAYLFDELFATFHGTRRPLQYLSDGGHFENTAVYELLRPERKINLIVVCDCGCDPNYEFADLANLVRLARIDFNLEIEVDRDVTRVYPLSTAFGTPEDFRPSATGALADNNKCALMLKVFDSTTAETAARPMARVVVLKPRLIAGIALDLMQYHATRRAFPQEPTADQFYDEAQWESYRKLGLEIATRVFGVGAGQDEYRREFWRYLLG